MSAKSASNEEVFSKWPFAIDPLRIASESRLLGSLPNVVERIFVTRLRPDRFTFRKLYCGIRAFDANRLLPDRS